MSDYYLWFKTIHIISVISWMAGLLYLPRLFIYQTENKDKNDLIPIFNKMEYKLLRYIMRPAGILTWFFGLSLITIPGLIDWTMYWMWIKLAFVILLTVCHFYYERIYSEISQSIYRLSSKQLRILNEIPTICMIIIVIMVVIKPI